MRLKTARHKTQEKSLYGAERAVAAVCNRHAQHP